MTRFAPTDLERIATLPLVGVDGEGAEHHFDQYADDVYVLQNGDVEHVEELGAGQLPEWVDYVADKRGWDDCRYDENGIDALVERLADALEGAA